jgi:hypothetical protein
VLHDKTVTIFFWQIVEIQICICTRLKKHSSKTFPCRFFDRRNCILRGKFPALNIICRVIKHVYHCEINPELSAIVKHNLIQLNYENITCIEGDSTETLKNLNQKFDWIYVDPSRRNDIKGKVFMLNDCLPNIPDLQSFYYQFSSKILIKTAPLLDITAGLTELQNVKQIHIVAVDNEVKELLWELHKNYMGKDNL